MNYILVIAYYLLCTYITLTLTWVLHHYCYLIALLLYIFRPLFCPLCLCTVYRKMRLYSNFCHFSAFKLNPAFQLLHHRHEISSDPLFFFCFFFSSFWFSSILFSPPLAAICFFAPLKWVETRNQSVPAQSRFFREPPNFISYFWPTSADTHVRPSRAALVCVRAEAITLRIFLLKCVWRYLLYVFSTFCIINFKIDIKRDWW